MLRRLQEMARLLFIFAKLNPGLTYVQGMNELLAPLYYLCRTDKAQSEPQHAEADSFYCFVELISEFRDNFCQQLDNSSVGIRATIPSLNALLKQHDRVLWHNIENKSKLISTANNSPVTGRAQRWCWMCSTANLLHDACR